MNKFKNHLSVSTKEVISSLGGTFRDTVYVKVVTVLFPKISQVGLFQYTTFATNQLIYGCNRVEEMSSHNDRNIRLY